MYFFKFNIGFIIQYVLAILYHFYQKKKKKEKIQTFRSLIIYTKKFSRFYQSPHIVNERLIFYQNKFYIVFILKKIKKEAETFINIFPFTNY